MQDHRYSQHTLIIIIMHIANNFVFRVIKAHLELLVKLARWEFLDLLDLMGREDHLVLQEWMLVTHSLFYIHHAKDCSIP